MLSFHSVAVPRFVLKSVFHSKFSTQTTTNFCTLYQWIILSTHIFVCCFKIVQILQKTTCFHAQVPYIFKMATGMHDLLSMGDWDALPLTWVVPYCPSQQQHNTGERQRIPVTHRKQVMLWIELMQAWVRWIDTHMKSIYMSKIEKYDVTSSGDTSIWVASKRNQLILSFLPPTLLMETRTSMLQIIILALIVGLAWMNSLPKVQVILMNFWQDNNSLLPPELSSKYTHKWTSINTAAAFLFSGRNDEPTWKVQWPGMLL